MFAQISSAGQHPSPSCTAIRAIHCRTPSGIAPCHWNTPSRQHRFSWPCWAPRASRWFRSFSIYRNQLCIVFALLFWIFKSFTQFVAVLRAILFVVLDEVGAYVANETMFPTPLESRAHMKQIRQRIWVRVFSFAETTHCPTWDPLRCSIAGGAQVRHIFNALGSKTVAQV